MTTILKQEILDTIKEVELINKELNKNIEQLNKIGPNTFFEDTTKNMLKIIAKNQRKVNELMSLMTKLLMKV